MQVKNKLSRDKDLLYDIRTAFSKQRETNKRETKPSRKRIGNVLLAAITYFGEDARLDCFVDDFVCRYARLCMLNQITNVSVWYLLLESIA